MCDDSTRRKIEIGVSGKMNHVTVIHCIDRNYALSVGSLALTSENGLFLPFNGVRTCVSTGKQNVGDTESLGERVCKFIIARHCYPEKAIDLQRTIRE